MRGLHDVSFGAWDEPEMRKPAHEGGIRVLTSFDLRPSFEAQEIPAETGRSGACGGDAVTPAADSPDARIEALYRAHGRALYRFLLRLTFGERQAAEDLCRRRCCGPGAIWRGC